MKILVPILSHSPHPDGVSRHGINLVRSIAADPRIDRVDVPVSPWQMEYVRSLLAPIDSKIHFHLVQTGRSILSRNLWFYLQLPRLARAFASDLVHLIYPVPLRRRSFDCPVIVTLHDLFPYDIPQNFGYPRVLGNRFILQQCLTAADAIACVSRSTLARLGELKPTMLHKSICIFNTIQLPASESPVASLQGRPFFLSIAQHRRNKNLPLTVEVFQRILRRHPDNMFVLVSNEGPETPLLRRLLIHKSLRDRVVLLQGITDPELLWLYRQCRVLLSTSTVEGFGLPVAEAILAGTPVICSDIPAFRELGNDLCTFVPLGPNAADSFAEATETALKRPRPAPVLLPHLSASVIAEQYIHLYRKHHLARRQDDPINVPAENECAL